MLENQEYMKDSYNNDKTSSKHIISILKTELKIIMYMYMYVYVCICCIRKYRLYQPTQGVYEMPKVIFNKFKE